MKLSLWYALKDKNQILKDKVSVLKDKNSDLKDIFIHILSLQDKNRQVKTVLYFSVLKKKKQLKI